MHIEYFNQIMILKYIIMNVLHMVLVKIGQGGHNFSITIGHYCIPGYSMKTYLYHILNLCNQLKIMPYRKYLYGIILSWFSQYLPRAQVQYVIKVCFHRISWYAVMSIVHTKIMSTLSNFY